MRFSTATLGLIVCTVGSLVAAEKLPHPAAPAAVAPAPAVSPRDVALDRLLTERESPAAFQAAIKQARKVDIHEQVILEARFLFLVDRHDDAAIAALQPEVIKHRATFKLEDSKIFASKDDWLAVNEYVEAIAALNNGDKDAFKPSHPTSSGSIWKTPCALSKSILPRSFQQSIPPGANL